MRDGWACLLVYCFTLLLTLWQSLSTDQMHHRIKQPMLAC